MVADPMNSLTNNLIDNSVFSTTSNTTDSPANQQPLPKDPFSGLF
jgi:hypothetical protein